MKRQVVIVGGGLAGLSAAECLLRSQPDRFEVSLFESKRTTGGRASSFTNHQTGDSIDYCQHVAMGCCTNFLQLLQRAGLSDFMQRSTSLQFLHSEHAPSLFAPVNWLPAPLHLALAIGKLNYLTTHQHRSIRRGLWRLMRTSPASLTNITAANWLRKNGQSDQVIRQFWDVILVSALGETTSVTSMAMARKVIIDGFAAAHGASDVLTPRVPLRQLIGEYLSGFINDLGASINTEQSVDSIIGDPPGIIVDQQTIPSDHVISAVAWHQIDRLLSQGVATRIPDCTTISQFPASAITGLHLWFDREITDRRHVVLVDMVSQWLFHQSSNNSDGSNSAGSDQHHYQIVISGSQHLNFTDKSELLDCVQQELCAVFPAARSAKLLRYQVVTDPNSVFSARPAVEALRPSARTALPWLHLAGDWIDTGWPATMEGAVISGIMAANSVLKTEGLSTVPVDQGLRRRRLAKWMIK